MKNYLFILSIVLLAGCKTKESTSSNDVKNDEYFEKVKYLKQYAVCQCIYEGLKTDSLLNKDNSTSGALDICDCDPIIFKQIDSLSKITAQNILPIQSADHDSKKRPVILACLNFQSSKKLDSLILSTLK